jgi:hypothetical protein
MPTDRFQFFAVLRKASLDYDLQRVVLTSGLQASLSQLFLEQSNEFTADGVKKTAFHGTYKPAAEEVISINPFPPPAYLERAAKNPQEFASISMPFPEGGAAVKAILAVDDGAASGTRRFFFQHFDRTHVLKPKRTLLFQSGMLHELTDPGLTVSERLTAVLVGPELLFRSFLRTNQFLDLAAYFRDATDSEIKTLLGHDTFCKNDAEAILSKCKPATRKRFSAILHSKILDHPKATPERIRTRAKRFGIALQVRVVEGSKRLVFPDDAAEAAKLLQYLAEELYFSDLTEQACETNSHRPLPAQPTGRDDGASST